MFHKGNKVLVVQSCSAEVQSNAGAVVGDFRSRGAADLPEPEWRFPHLHRQVHAASWLRAVSGKAHCLLGSEGAERKGERRDFLYLGNDLMDTSHWPVL